MSHLSRPAATLAGWPDLAAELDLWGEAGRTAALWWRDDDAISATPQLDLLLRLAEGVPLAVAVIPALAMPALADALAAAAAVAVLQHGWLHRNRAADGGKSEYPDDRAPTAVAAEIGAGRARLKALFGTRALPIFVPPWNRFADRFLPLLPQNGVAGLSAMARPGDPSPAGLVRRDVHVDVVAWRGDRGFIGAAPALGLLTAALRALRRGEATAGPIGILTHHRILDRAAAAFLDRLKELILAHPAARWADIGEVPA
ncbi:MAG TPA: hypothetical protein VJR70_06360 [Stellaceae bacterium]|nr:hypothetical protein [Stellaceae bacterium]